MKTRRYFLLATLLPFLSFVFAAPAMAQTSLPWQRNTETEDKYRSGNQRTYQEPGEKYDPSRHGSESKQQGYDQRPGSDNDRYDRGYDALRNDNGARQGYDSQRSPRREPRAQYGRDGNYGNDNRGAAPRRYEDRYKNGEANNQREEQRPSQGYPDRPYPGGSNSARGHSDGGYTGRENQGGRVQDPYATRRNDRNETYPRRDYDGRSGHGNAYRPPAPQGPGQAYAPPLATDRYKPEHAPRGPAAKPADNDTYSDDEILDAGHRFFGKITRGLARVIAHVFNKSGRPNAYILGEEGGGALIAGLRYGEGTMYTKSGERQRIYWQGPSVGYDFGAEGAKTMILVYNLHDTNKIFGRFAGVDGSAYLVGGIGVTFQKRGNVVLAPIRSGVGVRLGANVGYLKYTRRPTWNPF